MGRTKVKMLSAGVRELMTGAEVQGFLWERGNRVASAARGIAPRRPGTYADGIVVDVQARGDRAVARIGSTAKHAAVVEAAHGVMARALGAA